ncbi:MAG: alpha/beta hydrolase [Oscillospiraceae bacterium]|nr:alpha/beta hydrolase [Oscillospiraceae bacterium]
MSDSIQNEQARIMPPEEAERMLARLGELTLDVSRIQRKFLNCKYGDDPKQALDIYLPNEGAGPFPIVFYAHGGAWQRGRKDDAQVVPFMDGVKRGYAVVSIGYRLVPDVRYPDNMFDIKAALRWVARNAGPHMLDPTRTALCGSSAGAHLIMMAAFTQGQVVFGDIPGEPACRILAIVEQFGPTDFIKIHTHYDESGFPRVHVPGTPSAIDAMIGTYAESIPNMLRFYNPTDCVHPDVPPILLQHGKRDPMIPYQQAIELCEKVNKVAGEGKAELDLSEDFMHADPGYAAPESVNRIYGFIDKHLK